MYVLTYIQAHNYNQPMLDNDESLHLLRLLRSHKLQIIISPLRCHSRWCGPSVTPGCLPHASGEGPAFSRRWKPQLDGFSQGTFGWIHLQPVCTLAIQTSPQPFFIQQTCNNQPRIVLHEWDPSIENIYIRPFLHSHVSSENRPEARGGLGQENIGYLI